jgi:hypothetical protein
VAVQLVVELLGEAIADAARRYRSRLSERTQLVVGWLRDVAEPPPGVELRSADGATYTGFVVVERNELRLMLAVRHPPGPIPTTAARPPIVPPPPRERGLYNLLDPDDPRWDRDGDPFRR